MKIYNYGLKEGLMVCWDEVEDAAGYIVHLLIGIENTQKEETNYKELACIDVDRHTKYYTFKGLAKINDFSNNEKEINYWTYVEAENKFGEVISKSVKIIGEVYISGILYCRRRPDVGTYS